MLRLVFWIELSSNLKAFRAIAAVVGAKIWLRHAGG